MNPHVPGTRALRAFEAAGRLLNFTRAAGELGLTPAAISHQIKEFEDQFGIELFQRTSRSVRLTDAGAIVYEAVVEALGGLDQAVGRARKRSQVFYRKVHSQCHRLNFCLNSRSPLSSPMLKTLLYNNHSKQQPFRRTMSRMASMDTVFILIPKVILLSPLRSVQ